MTPDDLTLDLAAIDRQCMAKAEEDIRRRAELTLDEVISTGAKLMLNPRQTWRITVAVYGPHFTHVWPPRIGATPRSVLADCRRHLKAEEARGRERHWSFDGNRLIALRQAELALLEMIAGEGGEMKEAAE